MRSLIFDFFALHYLSASLLVSPIFGYPLSSQIFACISMSNLRIQENSRSPERVRGTTWYNSRKLRPFETCKDMPSSGPLQLASAGFSLLNQPETVWNWRPCRAYWPGGKAIRALDENVRQEATGKMPLISLVSVDICWLFFFCAILDPTKRKSEKKQDTTAKDGQR